MLVGSAVSLIPYAAPGTAILLFRTAQAYYHTGHRALLTVYAALLAAVLSLLVTPAVLLGAIALLYVVVEAFVRFRAARGRPVVRRQENLLASFVSVGFPLLLLLATSFTPWLPPEAIASGGSSTVGYVTRSDSRWTHVLMYTPRVVRIYETSAITSRTSCEMPPNPFTITLGAALGQLLAPRTTLPACPVP